MGIQQMMLATAIPLDPVSLQARVLASHSDAEPTLCTVNLQSNGTQYSTASHGPQSGDWFDQWLNTGAAGDYSVRCTVLSGFGLTGTTGTWESLAANRIWTLTSPTSGLRQVQFQLEIRNAAATVLATATFMMTSSRGIIE